MMRWVAVAGWLGATAFVLIQLLSDPVPAFPIDLAPTAFCLATAGLIAVGGLIGRIGALIGTGAAAFATIVSVVFAVSARGSWPIAIGAAVLLVVSFAAARELKPTPTPTPPG